MTFTNTGANTSFDISHLPFNLSDATIEFIPPFTLKYSYGGNDYILTSMETISSGKQKRLPTTSNFNEIKNQLTSFFGQGGNVTIPNTYDVPDGLAHITFDEQFLVKPLVFMIPNELGANAGTIRFKGVTTQGFDAVIVEPSNYDGQHAGQTVGYYSFLPGTYNVGAITVEVGYVDTKKTQGNYINSSNDIGWDRVVLNQSHENLGVITSIQTMNNEQNDVPTTVSSPWITSTTKIIDDKTFDLTLERSETSTDAVVQPERVAYIAFSMNKQSSFVDSNGNTIKVETIKSSAVGWDDGGSDTTFVNSYANTPIVLAGLISRKDSEGGWLRYDTSLTDNTKVNLKIDHDSTQDVERNHTAEDVASLVLSETFVLKNQ